ncbi:glucose 1-dehydrogenase [Rhizobiales bacterium GAS191]|jgi:NAD(P)-dependent dehydrogenase (short-subunit alcohol dehydrogenase family)|nr:glucose 1-dehydrogenase [Rhizobiales bacterium GAS113]SED67018.1 glucose 1-dehydrogenase [Rhizobiales bacterium GAS191]SEE74307.1 glucose 1-dehydrogenase [Rhizobiales bacterium GAS188]
MAKVLLVTGGSRGIGASVSRLAAKAGYAVALNYQRDAKAAEEVARDCRAAGAACEIFKGDMAVEADIERVFAEVDAKLGRLTHLVNNAGITGRSSPLDAAAPETIRAVIDLNVTGAILVARAAIKRMAKRHGGEGGAMVNISSVAAGLGSPGEYVWYAASKGAIDSLSIGLAKELATEGIRVNTVSPGMVDTEIHALSTGDAGRVARIAPLIPMRRVGQPDEIASAVLYLLSEEASYITGANLSVSGGR